MKSYPVNVPFKRHIEGARAVFTTSWEGKRNGKKKEKIRREFSGIYKVGNIVGETHRIFGY